MGSLADPGRLSGMNATAPNPDDSDDLDADAALGIPLGSERVDRWLIEARDPELTALLDEEDIDEDEHPAAARRIEAAGQVLYAALADLVDAYRVHPDLSYADALDTIRDVVDSLPPAPAEAAIPTDLLLTLAETTALADGSGDRPIGA